MSVSVIVPTYNHGHFISECLDSILTQEWKSLEVVVIDDASTDNTKEVLSKYSAKYPQIVHLVNQKNLGPALSINRAVEAAKGEYIVGCAADDFLLPGVFERGVEFLNRYPELALCCGDSYHFFNEKPYRFQFLKTLNRDKEMVFPPAAVRDLLRNTNFVVQSHATMYRKSCLVAGGGFNPDLYSLCDWYLNVTIALKWGFGYIPHPFAAYRLVSVSYANVSAKDRSVRKKTLDSLFAILDLPENASLRKTFRECFLFAQFNYRYFLDFLIRPKEWEITLFSFPKKCKNLVATRWKKLFASKQEKI